MTNENYQNCLVILGITSQQLCQMTDEQIGHLDYQCEELGLEEFRDEILGNLSNIA
jgi:hypothetical protein